MSSAPSRTERPAIPFRSVGIVGLGVMGGSLAKALSRVDDPPEVVGWALNPADLQAAVMDGSVTRSASSAEEVAGAAELLVLAVPLGATCALVTDLAPRLADGALMHDLASLKAPVLAAAQQAGVAHRWVGGHPMAGSESSGWAGAREDLYADARIWITGGSAPDAACTRIVDFWRGLGARPESVDAHAHDGRMALASHLPQLSANLLGVVMAEAGLSATDLGPGGTDMTRLAASSPEMWLEILAFSSPALTRALRDLSARAGELADQLDGRQEASVRDLMGRSRAWKAGT